MGKETKVIQSLKEIRDGLNNLIEALTVEKVVEDYPKNTVEIPAQDAEESKEVITKEAISEMTYTDLRAYAKELGLGAIGSRKELQKRVQDFLDNGGAPEKPVVVTEPKVEKVKVITPEVVAEDEEEEITDEIYLKVTAMCEAIETEAIADFLVEAGISPKGKRETLIDKLIQAVRDGLIELEDDEEEAEEVETEEEVSEEVEEADDIDEGTFTEEYRDVNNFQNPEMTEARKKACKAYVAQLRADFKSGELTVDDMVDFLTEFHGEDAEIPDDDGMLLNFYIDSVVRLIDDEGTLTEEGAYMLNGVPACCGRFLTVVDEGYHCDTCQEDYE
jgi:hypothetical protein